jgi:hypothetical protein
MFAKVLFSLLLGVFTFAMAAEAGAEPGPPPAPTFVTILTNPSNKPKSSVTLRAKVQAVNGGAAVTGTYLLFDVPSWKIYSRQGQIDSNGEAKVSVTIPFGHSTYQVRYSATYGSTAKYAKSTAWGTIYVQGSRK